MVIAIPSYNRPDIITLKLLTAFKPEDIYVFVNDEEQKSIYTVNTAINIVVSNTKGIQNARNAILDYFPEGEHIVQLDDDIEDFYKLSNGMDGVIKKQLEKMTPLEIKELFKYGFQLCEKNNTKLWGIYPVYNPFYMDKKINNKGFVIGSVCGIVNNELKFDNTLELKEDYDFTLKSIIKFKKIVRFDYITAKIKHYSNKGGCVDLRTEKENMEELCCNKLLRRYPKLLRRNPKRKNEVLINL